MKTLLDILQERVLVLDGAMGTSVQAHDLTVETDYRGCENCTEVLVDSRPDVVEAVHASFLEAGADAIETNTFGANPLVLAEFDLANEARRINTCAVEIARAACRKHATADHPRYVLGSMGPGTKLITLGQIDWATMFDSYRTQVAGLLDGGVDGLLIETGQDLLQVKCALVACLAELDAHGTTPESTPIFVSVTVETTGTLLVGSDIAAVATALASYPIASLGLNCATGPVEMREHVEWLSRHWPRAVGVVPNAGLPELRDGETVYPLDPDAFAREMVTYVEKTGVNLVGGCCGTTPAHIRTLVEALRGRTAARRHEPALTPGCTSLYGVTDYRQDTSILNIGERTNASGSRAFKRLLESESWDGIIDLAKGQVREGSHLIDINVDYAGRDNAADMAEIVRRVVRQVNVPLMLDSTQPATLKAGLRHAAGKCLINSANLEEGEEKFDELCRMALRYGAGLVLGCIDEDPEEAMARTAERKISIATRMHDLAVQRHGMAPEDLFFDPLVLPISTGMEKDRRSGLETILGTQRIATAFPRCQLTCGLSNISFGLKPAARVVLNSGFLHALVEAGMTSAIVHVSKILPRHRIDAAQWEAAMDLIHDRRPEAPVTLRDGSETHDPLQIFVDLFDDDRTATTTAVAMDTMPLEERLRHHIIDGEKKDLTQTLDAALKEYDPLTIINDHLLDGMKVVGDLFGSGQMQLPFVLQSAEVMKMAVSHLEPYMERVKGTTKGTIVLATVRGDVHDIGKNLVDIILTNNGYTVHNLGIKQPIGNIVATWQEQGADAIGLSGLLVKSVTVMEENLHHLNEQGFRPPVLLGGAALTRLYAEGHLRSTYEGSLYYGKDAFEALHIMDRLADEDHHLLDEQIESRLDQRATAEARRETPVTTSAGPASAVASPPTLAPAPSIPEPPFFGTRVVPNVDLETIYPFVNRVALYRGQWQLRKGRLSNEAYDTLIRETADPVFDRLCRQCIEEAILTPQVVYGYFPCASEEDELLLFDPDDHDRTIARFDFPRQTGRRRLCISDFFLPVGADRRDVIGLTCVTVGETVSARARALFESDAYSEYLYLHGFGVECAEALAEYWHRTMRHELNIHGDDAPNVRDLFTQKYRGSRYSFGYPACPDMSDQEKLFALLQPDRIGCALTENWQIDPEQSTSALVVHHPGANYFNV